MAWFLLFLRRMDLIHYRFLKNWCHKFKFSGIDFLKFSADGEDSTCRVVISVAIISFCLPLSWPSSPWQSWIGRRRRRRLHYLIAKYISVIGTMLVVILVIQCWISGHQVSLWFDSISVTTVNSLILHWLPPGRSYPDPKLKVHHHPVHTVVGRCSV